MPEAGEVAPNYRYWQEHGGDWADEYDARKRVQPIYHLQEILLTLYVSAHAPARVLEFGCGVGRHLRNLSQLPGVELHGHDQSRTMVAGALRWTGQAWLDAHVTIGEPTGPLPYPDGHFDLVYTSEVLVHVRPEDLEGVLSELVRVCRGQILHLEPGEHCTICRAAHDGCWNHDLSAAYGRLGLEAERLPSGYEAHTPVRVRLGGMVNTGAWPAPFLAVCRRLERDLASGLREAREQASQLAASLEQERGDSRRAAQERETELTDLRGSVARLRAELEGTVAELASARAELEAARADAAVAASARDEASAELRRLRDVDARAEAAERAARTSAAARERLEAESERLRAALVRQIRLTTSAVENLAGAAAAQDVRVARMAGERGVLLERLRALADGR